jgi:hypothetical protein
VKKQFLKILLLFVAFSLLPKFAGADWQATLKSHFDHVETFDGLADWTGHQYGDVHSDRGGDLPKLADGTTLSQWGYYSNWGVTNNSNTWIGNHGSDSAGANQLGNKSLAVDIFNLKGPSRLGTYFGNGQPNSGYQDMYVFYRVKIPHNIWPTSNVDNAGVYTSSYTAGQPYAYFYSWKFFNANVGMESTAMWDCKNVSSTDGCTTTCGSTGTPLLIDGTGNCRYGDTENLVHIKSGGGFVKPDLEVWFSTYSKWSTLSSNFPTDTWAGVEMHYTLESPANASNGKFEMWVYDANGNATQIQTLSDVRYRLAGNDNHYFNRIVFGGNNSNSFSFDPATMRSEYYVDDIVISGSRIGPTYYSLLNSSSDTTAPAAPRGLSIR